MNFRKSLAMNIALIGFGAIGRSLYYYGGQERAWKISAIIASQRSAEKVRQEVPIDVDVVTAVSDLKCAPDMVVECAGHDAVEMHGMEVLRLSWPLLVVSVGALADNALYSRLKIAAENSGARISIPAGALVGIDGIAAAQQAGIDKIILTSRKPPGAWKGTPAEESVDLDNLCEARLIYEGPARLAARDYPKNANTAATVSLAGPGFDRTEVRLFADPMISCNCHHVDVEGAFGKLAFTVENVTLPDNPKTSMMTVLSILRCLNNACAVVVI
jgi:aspartate dehydrogenase